MPRGSRLGLALGLVLALCQAASSPAHPPDGFVGAFRLSSDDPLFGGFSALVVTGDGAGFLALSDSAAYLRGSLARDDRGRVTAATLGPILPLKNSAGGALVGAQADSEGLAIGPGDRVCISFEIDIRVVCHDPISGPAMPLPQHAAFAQLPANGALEALAFGPEGALFTVPENPPGPDLPVFVFQHGQWQTQPMRLPRPDRFRPVAADFGPDGRFYLLERRFHGLRGFSSRLRRFDLGPDGFSGAVTLLQTRPGVHDNLEGLSVWRAPDGLRATMISDDNFLFLQVTEIVEYRLPD